MSLPRLRPVAAALATALAALFGSPAAHAGIELVAIGQLTQASDLSGLGNTLENGVSANLLGGIGSGLAWAGGSTFLALPDRGPNATSWNSAVDNTTSYISRFQTLDLALTKSASGALPYTLTPTLKSTTLLFSTDTLNYGSAPALTVGGQHYFSGRSDAFDTAPTSLSTLNARFDPEGIRVSADGKSVFVSDEYGPYLYQFDRATGQRIKTITLPSKLGVSSLNAVGATEISSNASGRVTNKGMEGLAISPDGSTLYGFMQSALLQDGGDGARYNRIIKVDLASGTTSEYAYDNFVTATKGYNSSELLALNDHQFLVLERDGKGLGDGSNAAVKQLRLVDLAGATDVSTLSGASALAGAARAGTLFLDLRAALVGAGLTPAQVPAKLEGVAFGADIVDAGVTYHTLYVANDNDFVSDVAGTNQFFVFRFTDGDLAALGGSGFVNQSIAVVPEPASVALMLAGLVGVAGIARRRARPLDPHISR